MLRVAYYVIVMKVVKQWPALLVRLLSDHKFVLPLFILLLKVCAGGRACALRTDCAPQSIQIVPILRPIVAL